MVTRPAASPFRSSVAAAIMVTVTFQVAAQTAPEGREAAAGETESVPTIGYDPADLPPQVARTRERIIEAARTGDIEQMRPVIEMNELPPTFSFGSVMDPVAFWKTASGDDNGREILAVMIELLESGYAHVDGGTPQEMYVWPYFHRVPLDELTPEQEVELYQIITPQERRDMEEFGGYSHFRFGIGPDGTWHYFVAGD